MAKNLPTTPLLSLSPQEGFVRAMVQRIESNIASKEATALPIRPSLIPNGLEMEMGYSIIV